MDPDNRRPVDFDIRAALLEALEPHLPQAAQGWRATAGTRTPEILGQLLDQWHDGRIELWITAASLRLRRARPDLFRLGTYTRLEAKGGRAAHLFAFARTHGTDVVAAIVPRFVSRLGDGWRAWTSAWGDTRLALPAAGRPSSWVNVFTGEPVEAADGADGGVTVEAGTLLRSCPVALLLGSSLHE